MPEFLTPSEVDDLLRFPIGKAKRLAKRGILPAVILADGTIRFDAAKLQAHLNQPRPATKAAGVTRA